MAITFNKKSWQSRVSEHPTRRRLTIVDQSLSYSLVDVAREEGTVEQVGDTFDKSTMDDLENRIDNIRITAQAECDGLQTQIDNLPSLDEAKAVDIGHKETCSTNTPLGGSVRVNPFELYNGTVAYKTTATQEGLTSQTGTPTPDNPVPIVGIGTEQADHTWNVTVGGVTASGLAYPLYEGDILDFANSQVIRANGVVDLGTLAYSKETQFLGTQFYKTHFANDKAKFKGNVFCTEYSCGIYNYNNIPDLYLTLGNAQNNVILRIRDDSKTSFTPSDFKTAMDGVMLVYELATPTIERVTITGADSVIRGFIPSARFFQMGRRYIEESAVMNPNESLNDYFKGYTLQSESTTLWYSQEDVDDKANVIWTQYGYDVEHQSFLDSVAGEIYTPTGAISCDFTVSDIWAYGADAVSEKCVSGFPASITNRLATNSNGFPIELTPTTQSLVSSLTVGSPVQFRITGDLYINVERGGLLCREQGSSSDSQFYEYDMGSDARQGVHYHQHYFDVPRGTSIQLSDYTFALGYTFNLCQYRDSSTWLNELSWTVTDSDVVITANNDTTANGIVLSIRHRKNGDTEGEYDTFENIVINVT